MSGDVASRFDLETISAGVLRLINDKPLRTKFVKFIDPDHFFYGDKTTKIQGFRRILKQFINDSEEDNLSEISFGRRLVLGSPSEEQTQAVEFYNWMISDEKVRQESVDNGCFGIFMDYLKVTELLKWSKPFMAEYRSGNVGSAIESMRKVLPKIEKITLDEDLTFSVDDIDTLLPQEDASAGTVLMLDSPAIDAACGGFEKQTLNLIIALTNGGKTMFAHHLIRRCVAQKMAVHIAVVEDRPKSFARRIVSALTGIPINKLRYEYHKLTTEELVLIENTKRMIRSYVKVDFMYNASVEAIHQKKLEYDQERRALGLAPYIVDIVDYTAHLVSSSRDEKKHDSLHAAYKKRKDFALQYNKIAFDFAQINREGAKRNLDNRVVTHADLAGGFDIAHVCDTIFSLNTNAQQKQEKMATIHSCKGRDGEAGGMFEVKTDFSRARWLLNDALWKNATTTGIDKTLQEAVNSGMGLL